MTHERVDTTRQAHVLVDIGGDVGALVVVTDAALNGAQVDVSRAGEPLRRTHVDVHARTLSDRLVHAAVFPHLREGAYDVWMRDHAKPVARATVHGARVSELLLPS